MSKITVQFSVSGRVQGVGFRQATAAKARQLALNGWVRNLEDGRVEGCASGDPAALEALQQWLHCGPPLARVTDLRWQTVDTAAQDLPGGGFQIRR